MMRCTEVRPLLSFFLEKETGPLQTLETRRHLDGCDPCRARAAHLASIASACTSLAELPPPVDLSSSVMNRLRSMAGGMKGAMPSARWGGLSIVLGSFLALLSRHEGGMMRALIQPLDYLAAFFAGTESAGSSEGLAQAAASLALAIAGKAGRPELIAGAGVDLVMTVQVVATALLIGLLLAIPVAVLTAWFLKDGLAGRQIPRL